MKQACEQSLRPELPGRPRLLPFKAGCCLSEAYPLLSCCDPDGKLLIAVYAAFVANTCVLFAQNGRVCCSVDLDCLENN